MHETKTFYLPDLGEGLPDAEIVEWHVKTGDVIRLDQPLVSMETAKAVVEVPSPFSGKVVRRAGEAGDVILTGAALVDIELDPALPQRADAHARQQLGLQAAERAATDNGHARGGKGLLALLAELRHQNLFRVAHGRRV